METQPLEGSSQESLGREEGPWGWLVTLAAHLPPALTPLQGDRVGVGREAEVVVDHRLFDKEERENRGFLKVSRKQFEVFIERDRAALVDKSFNGTFVNEVRVGKDKSARLTHGDTIGVLEAEFGLYCFLQESTVHRRFPQLAASFLVGRQVGSGACAQVMEAFTREAGVRRALKVISKKEDSRYSDAPDLLREVDVLRGIRHPCITQVLEVFHSEEQLMIVMDFAAGGELFDQVVKDWREGTLKEANAKIQMYQIVSAIAFLHSRRVCHRDLKLENILLETPGPTSRIKVTDFGLSKRWSSTSLLQTFVGTPTYMAPEVLGLLDTEESAPYSSKSDLWSLGVILYTLLSGSQPFRRSSAYMTDLKKAVMAARYLPMVGSRWARVSEEGKAVVERLLQVDTSMRPTAAELLEMEWVSGDMEAVAVARRVMGVEEETDSGRGSSSSPALGRSRGVEEDGLKERRIVVNKRKRIDN